VTTIREVAERSGVSVATVSRVFNDYPDVSEATRERVLAAARDLEYAPSAAARTLVGRRSQLIGVGLFTGFEHPDIDHPFFQDVLVGLKHGVGARGYDVLLFASEQPGAYLRRARHHRVDGVVLWGVDSKDPELPALVTAGIPLVTVDLVVEGPHATWVTSDSVEGARLAVRHLHELGHRRIATIAGLPRYTKPGGDRLSGYREETAALGLEPLEREGDFYSDSGEAAMRELLALPEPPTAVFAASDLMAFGAIKAALASGLRVPDDVSIVGFDDIAAARLAHPRLTTIRHDKVGLGLAAAQALIDEIEHPAERPPAPVTLPVELVVRESTGPRATSP
jgi:LacI family transcriptional regulator, galactose operon repressor